MGALGNGLSGSDRIFIELARRWSKEYPVYIYLWEEGEEMCRRQNLKNSDQLKLKTFKMGFWCRWGFIICYFARIIRAIFEAWRLDLEPKNTIVYSASEFWMDVLPALVIKLRYPKIVWIAAWYQTAPNPWKGFSEGERKNKYRVNALYYWLMQFFIKPFISRFADFVLVNNDNEEKQFPKLLKNNRVKVLLGAVDLESIKKWQKEKQNIPKIYDAVFQGRFHPQKGIIELIDIWKLVVSQKPGARLALIGDGSLMFEVKQKITELKLENNIELFGYVYDGSEKYKIFSESKIVLHPAFYDSGGMAAAEAMVFGLPCVGFDLKSYKYYYPRGMVKVEIGNLNAFADKIIEILDDQVLRKKIGNDAAIMINKNWSWDKRASELLFKIKNSS